MQQHQPINNNINPYAVPLASSSHHINNNLIASSNVLPLNQQQQQLQQNYVNANLTSNNISNSNLGQQYPNQGNLLAGAQLQAPANNSLFSKIFPGGSQQTSFQPPNQVIAANIANDSYNIPPNQLVQPQQQFLPNLEAQQLIFQQVPTQLQAQQQFPIQQQSQLPLNSYQANIQQQQYPLNQRSNSQQQQVQPGNYNQPAARHHHLQHQRSLPLPPPIFQQLQQRQQQQQLQRHYYQSANKLHFDDHRYYAGSNPLLEQPQPLHVSGYYNQIGLNDSPFYQHRQQPAYYQQPTAYTRSRRSRYNLESTRGLNHSLQSQWLYGGGGRRSMAGDLLMSGQASVMGGAGDPLDAEQKIVNDFCILYDESRQLFNGLRNLPQIGHKGWQAHFETAFNAYTRLWRFQQQYRHILDSKFDLKRWQIGEIASKIAQLYYHYYLRTSDCSHLIEACNFYAAIRSRGYFNILGKDIKASLVIKKLRYYARYIVVCLLSKRMKLVHELVREFSQSLDDYSHVYEPEAQLEWSLVLQEIKAFIDAESIVSVVSGPGHPDGQGVQLTLSQRLRTSNIPQQLKMPIGKLFLSEVLIMGNYQRQVKFSELTVDMYRILQILEREPNEQQQQSLQQQINVSPEHQNYVGTGSQQQQQSSKTFNLLARPTFNGQQGVKGSPHKYLLFGPTFSQLFLFLASGFKELPQHGVILLYLSADGSYQSAFQPPTTIDEVGYDLGGVATNPTNSNGQQSGSGQRQTGTGSHSSANAGGYMTGVGPASMRTSQSMHFKQLNCLHPGDLYPFTRKPFVLIVDSNNSYAFQHMPRHFGLPLLVLMSPTEYPAPFNDNTKGSLFTLFLHCPITALCSISNIIELPETIWRDAQFYLDKFYTELGQMILQSRLLDPSYISLCSDDFLRLLIYRFIFCFMIMKLHRLFRTNNYYPRSYPPLPEAELLQHPTLKQIISDMTVTLDIRTLFD